MKLTTNTSVEQPLVVTLQQEDNGVRVMVNGKMVVYLIDNPTGYAFPEIELHSDAAFEMGFERVRTFNNKNKLEYEMYKHA